MARQRLRARDNAVEEIFSVMLRRAIGEQKCLHHVDGARGAGNIFAMA